MTDIGDEDPPNFSLVNMVPNPAGGMIYPLSFDKPLGVGPTNLAANL